MNSINTETNLESSSITDVLKQDGNWNKFANTLRRWDLVPRLKPVMSGRHHHLMERLAGVPSGTYDSLEGLERPSEMTGDQFVLFKFLEVGWGEIHLTIPENQELEYSGYSDQEWEMIELLEYVEGISPEAKERAVKEIKNGSLKAVLWE